MHHYYLFIIIMHFSLFWSFVKLCFSSLENDHLKYLLLSCKSSVFSDSLLLKSHRFILKISHLIFWMNTAGPISVLSDGYGRSFIVKVSTATGITPLLPTGSTRLAPFECERQMVHSITLQDFLKGPPPFYIFLVRVLFPAFAVLGL